MPSGLCSTLPFEKFLVGPSSGGMDNVDER